MRGMALDLSAGIYDTEVVWEVRKALFRDPGGNVVGLGGGPA
jgi:hypothetical protein